MWSLSEESSINLRERLLEAKHAARRAGSPANPSPTKERPRLRQGTLTWQPCLHVSRARALPRVKTGGKKPIPVVRPTPPHKSGNPV